jgi:class 3 adenylate cyclase/tetratricopeptide (TPR) repeat protein
MFADVSGFTPMSEALGRVGRRGTEELTSILNSYFEPTITLIHSFGGTVGKFGGDAMTVLFPYRGKRAQQSAARRAIQCALDMQASMDRYRAISTSAGVFSLTVKVGMALGPVMATTVGDAEIQLEHVLAGRVLDRCAEAEHHATAGEVVAHQALVELVDGAAISNRRAPYLRVFALSSRARRAAGRPPPQVSRDAGDLIAPYLHPSLVARLRAGQIGLINEHRKVTIIFGRFEELDYDRGPEAGATLQRYVREVVRTIDRYGGSLRQVDMGDKGSKYIAVFGAPIAHEDDEERALRCAADLHALPVSPSAIGVSTGLAFCGLVGSSARREYAVMGDAVNTAARLMQAAEFGQTLVSGATQGQVEGRFSWTRLEPLKLKGKSRPVPVFEHRVAEGEVSARLHEPAYPLPMVGRESELNEAREIVARARNGRGQVMGITGDAGIGKSRFVAEVAGLAVEAGMMVHAGAAQSYGSSTSYLVWRDVWRSFFDLQPSRSARDELDYLQSGLDSIAPNLAERAPLLSPVLNIPLPENELTTSLDPQMRTESLKDLLLTCLRHRAEEVPLLLVLEDCHWVDEMSQELLELVGRNLADRPILLTVLYRTPEGESSPISWAMRRPNCSELALTELAADQVDNLIRLKARRLFEADGEPPAALVERVTEQAQGNPFYVEEILNFVHDRGVKLDDTRSLAALEVPDSLQSLIMARIDALGEAEKATLKVASVIGRLFKAAWLWGSFPEVGKPGEVKQHLGVLSRLDLTPLDKPEPELEYIFKHSTTQEVAYESLAFGTREALHERLGDFIEGSYREELGQYVDVLAHHYGYSRNTDKQQTYFRRAGDAAKASYANEAALNYYGRLLPLLSRPEETDVLLQLGEVRQLIGEWDEAEQLYRQALSRAEEVGSERDQARCRATIGTLLSYTQSFDDAVRWLQQAKGEFERLGDESELGRTLEQLTYAYFQRSDYPKALSCSEEHMRLAERLDDQASKSAALENLGLIHWHQGEHDRALEYLARARSIAADIDYKRGVIHANNDLAGFLAERGDYAKAVERLDEAFAVASEIGYQQQVGVIVANAGELCARQGDYPRALACSERALQIAARLGDWTGVLDAVGRIGTICAAEGRHSEAHRLFDRAIAMSRAVNDRWFLCESLRDKAELFAGEGRPDEANTCAQEALAVAREAGNDDIELAARLLLARLEVTLGLREPREAISALEALLGECSGRAESAAVHYCIWRLDEKREQSRGIAADLYRRLYDRAPHIEYRRRYEKLTGERLPDPRLRTQVAETVEHEVVDLESLVQEAETLTGQAI